MYFVLSEAVSRTPCLWSQCFASHLWMFIPIEHLHWSWNNSRAVGHLLCLGKGRSCAPSRAPAVASCCSVREMLAKPGACVTH